MPKSKQTERPKALFEEIFDGPDSMFGRIFGPSRFTHPVRKQPETTTIRVRLTPEQLERLSAGKELQYRVKGQTILLSPPEK